MAQYPAVEGDPEEAAHPVSREQRPERQIDALLDEMSQLTEEQRLAFVETIRRHASLAGTSADQAAATLRKLGRMLANRK